MPEATRPWQTPEWSSSWWNHVSESDGDEAFPESVRIHDSTLRAGEQQAGVVFGPDDKLRIADQLAEVGVHRIDAGRPAASLEDQRVVRRIARRGLPSEIFAHTRAVLDDVRCAADCGVAGITMEVPASRHLVEQGYGWTMGQAIELAVDASWSAHRLGLKVSLLPVDATRARRDDYGDLVTAVARDGHLDALVLADSSGSLAPQSVGRFVAESRSRVNVPLEVDFRMDHAMGVANSLIAAALGAATIHVTVGGLGARAGCTPLEETVVALRTLYDLDVGMHLDRLSTLHDLVMTIAGVRPPADRAITGAGLFEVEAGDAVDVLRHTWALDPTVLFPFTPGLVGQHEVRIVLGKGSGPGAIRDGLAGLGLSADARQTADILARVKRRSLGRKGPVSADELRRISAEVTASSSSIVATEAPRRRTP